VLDIDCFILNGEPGVRWEKVDHVRVMLTSLTYRVSPEQVATKVIDQMLESGTHHWKGGSSSRLTNARPHVGEAF
jgi:hypothetical protein